MDSNPIVIKWELLASAVRSHCYHPNLHIGDLVALNLILSHAFWLHRYQYLSLCSTSMLLFFLVLARTKIWSFGTREYTGWCLQEDNWEVAHSADRDPRGSWLSTWRLRRVLLSTLAFCSLGAFVALAIRYPLQTPSVQISFSSIFAANNCILTVSHFYRQYYLSYDHKSSLIQQVGIANKLSSSLGSCDVWVPAVQVDFIFFFYTSYI